MYKRNAEGWSKHIDFLVLDELALQLSLILATLINQHQLPYAIPIYRILAVLYVFADAALLVMLNTLHNVLKRGSFVELWRTAAHCVLVFAVGTVYMFAGQTGSEYSRLVLFTTLGLHFVIGYITRIGWKQYVRKHGTAYGKSGTMLAVLNTDTADIMMKRLLDNDVEGFRLVGAVLDGATQRTDVLGVPIVAALENVSEYIAKEWIDVVYIDCPATDPRVKELVYNCNLMAIAVHYHIPAFGSEDNKQFIEKVAGTTVVTSTINYLTPFESFMKRAVDILGGIVGSLFALLAILFVGPIIKIKSPGPILYTQDRVGRNGKIFKIYKIRSMYMDADERKKELMEQNRIKDGMMFKLDWDPRIIGNRILPDGTKKTGIGEAIRKKSIDELPQFFNVVLGQMSLVGTRPPTVDEWEKYEYHHRARLACKPGITGLWQVSGRSKITDFEEVVRLDTEYITNWTFAEDIKILLKTVVVVFKGTGAM